MHGKNRRSGWFGFVALLCCLVLAGCGGGGTSTGATGETRTQGNALQPGEFDADSSMATIQERGKLIVGVPMNLPPFASRNPSTGSIEGFDIEMARLIASGIFGAQIEGKVEFVEIDSRDRELLLEQNRIDIALGRYEITVPRKRFVDFAGPYYIATQDIVVLQSPVQLDDPIRSAGELNGRKVCTVRGSTRVDEITAALPGADLSMVKDSVSQCIAELNSESVVAVAADHVDLLAFTSNNSARLKELDVPGVPGAPYGIGISKERVDLRGYVNNRLDEISKDNGWDSAYDRTIGKNGRDEQPAVERY